MKTFRRLLSPRKINQRFLIFFLPLLFVFCLAIVIVSPRQQVRSGLRLAEGTAHTISALSAHNLGSALYFNDTDGIREASLAARENKNLIYFLVVNVRGDVLLTYSRDGNVRLDLKELAAEGPSANQMIYRTVKPIQFRSKTIGVLYLGVSLEDMQRAWRASRLSVFLLSLAVFLLGSTVIILISAVLSRSLRRVTDTASRIAAGDLSLRAPETSPDEIGQLGRSFNIMVEHLERSHQTLEQRVLERTQELENEVGERERVEEALRKREELFRSMMERLSEGVGISDLDQRIIYANPALDDIFGVPEGQLAGRNVKEFTPPGQLETLEQQSSERRKGRRGTYETVIIRADGQRRDINISAMPMWDGSGAVTSTLAVVSDITARKQDDEIIRKANDQLRNTVRQLAARNEEMNFLSELYDSFQACREEKDLYFFTGQYAQKLFPQLWGRLYILNASKNLLDLATNWGDANDAPAIMSPEDCWALRSGKPYFWAGAASGPPCPHMKAAGSAPEPTLCMPLTSKGGILGLLHLGLQPGTDTGGTIEAGAALLKSRELLAANFLERLTMALVNFRLGETLKQQSIRDVLTGLFNRRYLEETLEREIYRSQRDSTTIGVMMLDIDRFKRFNDDFGHEAGDVMLKAVSEFLQRQVRREDIVCRYGGEEFVIILPTADSGISKARAERILKGIRELKIYHAGKSLGPVTFSIGASCFPNEGNSAMVLLAAADAALFRAKRAGRDRVVYGAGCIPDEEEND